MYPGPGIREMSCHLSIGYIMSAKSIVFLSICFCFISCDPGIGVVISNRTAVERNIRVIYPEHFSLPVNFNDQTNDSLQSYDLAALDRLKNTADYYKHLVRIPILSLDTVNRTYTFNLKAGHKVIIESRWPSALPTFGQTVIIDNTDTIRLTKKGTDFRKKPKLMLGGTWTFTIIETEQLKQQ